MATDSKSLCAEGTIDDYCIFTTDKDEAEKIFNHMNNVDEHISFEIEHPRNRILSFLDFTVSIKDGAGHFPFYRKPEKKDTWPHFKSAIPSSAKKSIYSQRNTTNK